MIRIAVKVVPGARKSRVVGRLGDAVKVQVSAPPEKGKANEAVVQVLAEFLGVRGGQVTVIAGQTTPRKTVQIEGIDPATLEARLSAL